MIHLILKQFLQASYFTMYITKICFLHSSFMCIWVMQVKNSFVLYSWRGKYPLIYYYYLYRYSIFYNLWRQFTKIYQQMWYDDLHIQVLHVYKTVWLEICSQCFLTQQNKQQNETVFLLFFRNNSLTLCRYQPLGFYQLRTMLVPPLLPSLTLG